MKCFFHFFLGYGEVWFSAQYCHFTLLNNQSRGEEKIKGHHGFEVRSCFQPFY